MTTTTTPVQQVDLTAPSGSLTYVEVLTPAGIVRVNTNLVDWRSGQAVVAVEIEHNRAEEWNVGWADRGSRFDVTLTRDNPPATPETRESEK